MLDSLIYLRQWDVRDVHNPKITKQLKEVVKKGKSQKISIGTIATSPKHMEELISYGVNFIVYLVDMNVLANSYAEICSAFKKFK